MSRRVVIIGNLTIDDVVRPDGSTSMGQPGGNAVYAALGARLWSPDVGIVTRSGADLPGDLLPSLTRLGVDLGGVVPTDLPVSRAWLLYETDGSRRFIDRTEPADDGVQAADIPMAWLEAAEAPVVHIAPMAYAAARDVASCVRKCAPSAVIVVDPHESWVPDDVALSELAADIDVFAPSRDELVTLTGSAEVDASAEQLRLLGFAAVVVKLGAEGALVVDASGARRVAAAPVEPVDVTGAGDTFCGALAGALAAGLSLDDSVLRATRTASWSIELNGSLALGSWDSSVAQARLDGLPVAPRRTVAVLGSARLGPEDPRWEEARALGAALGAAGWDVMTGGYGGLMAATAQGAAEAGARVIGLPMTAWVDLEPSIHVSELRWSADYAERLTHILGADVVVALPGGIGTLAEATVAWSALQTEPGAARLVLYGSGWARLVEAFGADLVIGEEDLRLAPVGLDVDDAMALIERAYRTVSSDAAPRG